MEKSMARLLVIAAMLAVASMGAHAQDTAQGKALAEKNCAQCHAIGATGESPLKEAPPFREIVTRYPVENLAEALAEGITVGHEAMPEYTFSPDEITELLTYLDSLKSES